MSPALLAVALAAIVLNLLRLANAGGGAAPHYDEGEVESWAPGAGALGALALLSVCFAHPILLWGARAALDPVVAEHRAEPLLQHDQVIATMGGAGVEPLHADRRADSQRSKGRSKKTSR